MKKLTRAEEFELQELVKEGKIEELSAFLKQHPEVAHKDYNDLLYRCADVAIKNKDVDALKLLVEAHPRIEFSYDDLAGALESRDLRLAKLMLERGADPNAKWKDPMSGGKVPDIYHFHLHEVTNSEAVKLLIMYGADPDIKDSHGATPLHNAGYNVAKALLEGGATVNVVDEEGKTPLLNAINRGDIKTVKLLLEHNANINKRGFKQPRPLCAAIANGDAEMVKLLLENGATLPIRYTFHGVRDHSDPNYYPFDALEKYKQEHPGEDVSEIEKLLHDAFEQKVKYPTYTRPTKDGPMIDIQLGPIVPPDKYLYESKSSLNETLKANSGSEATNATLKTNGNAVEANSDSDQKIQQEIQRNSQKTK